MGPMITESQPQAGRMPQTRKSAAEAAVDLLASVKFAVAVIVVIIVACVAGTILPQGAEASTYVQDHPAAAARFALFAKLGLTHVFNAFWFIALLCVLASSVMVCSTRRFATVKRANGFAKRRAFGSLLTHLSILLILGGAVARGVWGEKGSVALRAGETIAQFDGNTGPQPLPFALQLAKFEIETDPAAGTRAAVAPETPPMMKRSIKNFRSTVQLVDNGVAVGERTIAVNSPLKVKGYTFYQTGYNPDDLSWTSLRVVRDPGVPFVYAGFILLIGGLFVVFYLNPWLTAREAKA